MTSMKPAVKGDTKLSRLMRPTSASTKRSGGTSLSKTLGTIEEKAKDDSAKSPNGKSDAKLKPLKARSKTLSAPARQSEVLLACNAYLNATAGQQDAKIVSEKLEDLRKAILTHGITETRCDRSGKSERCKVWKTLLGVTKLDATAYLALVDKKESTRYTLIRDDIFRTFNKDMEFAAKVDFAERSRCLNAFTHSCLPDYHYTQGMNILAGCLQFCMPELDAFHCLVSLVTHKFPTYWRNPHPFPGLVASTVLLEEVLMHMDPDLLRHLDNICTQEWPSIIANPALTSLSGSAGPLKEAVQLFDFFLAFGVHLNIYCVAAQLVLWRETLLKFSKENSKDVNQLRTWPVLDAKKLIAMCTTMMQFLPPELQDRIAKHTTDFDVCKKIIASRETIRKQFDS